MGAGASASSMVDKKEERRRLGRGEAGDACTRSLRRGLQGQHLGENPIFAPVSPHKMGETPPPENQGESGGCPSVADDVNPPPTPLLHPPKKVLKTTPVPNTKDQVLFLGVWF